VLPRPRDGRGKPRPYRSVTERELVRGVPQPPGDSLSVPMSTSLRSPATLQAGLAGVGPKTATRAVGGYWLLGLYALTMLVSATLLFLVQPMFARMVLPLLGGSPAVWNTTVVFYQAMLLGGYGYAHAATGRLGRRQ